MPAADLLPGDRLNWPTEAGEERLVTVVKRLSPQEGKRGLRTLRVVVRYGEDEGLLIVGDHASVDARYE